MAQKVPSGGPSAILQRAREKLTVRMAEIIGKIVVLVL
jgi:hypothetical protein